MKIISKLLLMLSIIIPCNAAFAQNSEDVQSVIKQGVQLNDEGKYAEAIDKYNESLAIAKKIGNKEGIARTLNNLEIVKSKMNKVV